jgi:hypothetical protein
MEAMIESVEETKVFDSVAATTICALEWLAIEINRAAGIEALKSIHSDVWDLFDIAAGE